MIRKTYPYHPTREQAMTNQQHEFMRTLKDPSFLAMLKKVKTRVDANGVTHLELSDDRSIFAAAVMSYKLTMHQSKKPETLARLDARASAKKVLEQYNYDTPENLHKVIAACR